jgi:hypothetical protein
MIEDTVSQNGKIPHKLSDVNLKKLRIYAACTELEYSTIERYAFEYIDHYVTNNNLEIFDDLTITNLFLEHKEGKSLCSRMLVLKKLVDDKKFREMAYAHYAGVKTLSETYQLETQEDIAKLVKRIENHVPLQHDTVVKKI